MNPWLILSGLVLAVALGGVFALRGKDRTSTRPSASAGGSSMHPSAVQLAGARPPAGAVRTARPQRLAPRSPSVDRGEPAGSRAQPFALASPATDRAEDNGTGAASLVAAAVAGPAALPPKSEDRVTTEAAQRLDRLTEAYGLSAGQRAAILPILLRHASTARMSAAAATGALGVQSATAAVPAAAPADSLPAAAPASAEAVNAAPSVPSAAVAAATPANGPTAVAPLPIGSTTDAVAAEIYPLLDASQQQALAESLIDQDLWWTDIVGLLAQDDTTGSATAAQAETVPEAVPADPGEAVPAPSPVHPDSNLWDLVQGSN